MARPIFHPGRLCQVTAIRPDVFRLRVSRTATFSRHRSTAVVGEESGRSLPPAAPGRRILRTPMGSLAVSGDGGWTLRDSLGTVVLSSPAGGTGFLGREPQVLLDLVDGESLFGLGETTGTFNRRGQVREFWNIDVLGHAPGIHPALTSLYVSIPFALSLRDGRAAGYFWDNPARQTWDLGQTDRDRCRMAAASGEIDLYLFLGPSVESVVTAYSRLTGTTPRPPRWALGYHQCRYSYETREQFEEVAREFRRRQLPCDALYLDIHHMDGYRVFTFGDAFPNPAELLQEVGSAGFRVVAIVDPGVKDDPEFPVLKRGIGADAFVKEADGRTDFVGEVWPGRSRFPDFLRAATRTWWGEEQRRLLETGVAGVWNDMNEPANFARPDKTLAPDAVHRTASGRRPHSEVHNLYGMEMARASREGALRFRPDERPFVITRAGYAGIQRHAIVWTGDNTSHWGHLEDALQMLLNLSVSGVPFCGADVGGFLGNATPELFARWFQFATFTPFFRGHSNLGTNAHEPWAFGPEVEAVCRSFLQLRYQLVPYLEGLLDEAHRTATPVMRPLFWHHSNDPVAVACGDQFLLGRQILVAPVLRQGMTARSVYLPADVWYDLWTGQRYAGGTHIVAETPPERIPVFVRAGSLLPLGPERQFLSSDDTLEGLQLHVWPGFHGQLDWYEDDGFTNAHEKGDFHRRRLLASTREGVLTLGFGATEGSRTSGVGIWRLVVWDADRQSKVRIQGRKVAAEYHEGGFVTFEVPDRPEAFQIQVTEVGRP